MEALSGLLAKGKLTLDDMAQYCSEDAKETLEQLRTIIETADKLSDGYTVEFDPSLVRGQGYYTGTVFEVASKQFGGTVAGGGRYDNLIGRFTGDTVPAVGFSIGFERIFSIVTENNIQLAGSRKKTAILRHSGYHVDRYPSERRFRQITLCHKDPRVLKNGGVTASDQPFNKRLSRIVRDFSLALVAHPAAQFDPLKRVRLLNDLNVRIDDLHFDCLRFNASRSQSPMTFSASHVLSHKI